ncbi:MAG: UbiA family prenyltransferase [Planctomycetales bacterium]|nr:UbiA family prenyltransferase [Planctomycetales bacterium]
MTESTRQHDRDHSGPIDTLEWGQLSDWAQLVRLPNTFTLLSDTLAAAVVAVGGFMPLSALLPTVVASLCAYWAGMILNDVVDIDQDREHRPSRPLAAGKISPAIAGQVAKGMLLFAPILVLATNTFHVANQLWLGAAFVASGALSASVLSYNSILKSTPLGPMLMGLCRSLNILMVGSTMLAVNSPDGALDWPIGLFAFASGIGIYILGVTVYASSEEGESQPSVLAAGMFFEVVGLATIAATPWWMNEHGSAPAAWSLSPQGGFPLLITLIALTVLNRGLGGVMQPVARKVQLAVRHAILTLILIDAGVVLMWAGPWLALGIVLMLAPALSTAIRFRST